MKKSPRFDWFLKKETCWHSPTSFASGVGAWGAPVQGVKAYPKSLDSLKIWAKSLKFRTKSLNIWTKSLKIWAKWRLTLFDFKKCHPTFAEKHMETFLEGTPKVVFMIFVGESMYAKLAQNFQASLVKFGQNSSHPQNLLTFSPMYTTMKKTICPLLCLKFVLNSTKTVCVPVNPQCIISAALATRC